MLTSISHVYVCSYVLYILLGDCGGWCIAGNIVGATFATGIAVIVIVLIIMFTRKRTRKVTAVTN